MIHITCSVCKLLHSALMIALVIQRVTPTPTGTGRWTQPCNGRTVISQPILVTPSPEPQSDIVVAHNLYVLAQEITQLTGNIKNDIFSERIQSGVLRAVLDDSLPLAGFPIATAIPSPTTFVHRLKQDYTLASKAAVFLEEIRSDEEALPTTTNEHANELRRLEQKIYSFLCQVYVALQDRAAFDVTHVSRQIMIDADRNPISIAERYNRDYKILKDTVDLFWAVARGYESFRS